MSHTVEIELLDKPYQLKCPADSAPLLKQAGVELDKKLREARDSGIIGADRIAMMAALNVCYEMLSKGDSQQHDDQTSNNSDMEQSIQLCCDKIRAVTGA